jgi:hypothetical protein
MARSADRPAAAFEDFVDDDGGITQDAAIAWLRHEYVLSEGAAIPHFRRAWASGNVRGRTRRGWDYFETSEDGAIGRDERQLGKPPAQKAPKRKPRDKPTQPKLDKALLNFAKAGGEKLKQHDVEARAMLEKIGATSRQITKAFQTLPKEYRHFRGKPAKSSA